MTMRGSFKYQDRYIEVWYSLQAAEDALWYTHNGDGYPGCEARVFIHGIEYGGRNIKGLVNVDKIAELILKEYDDE